LVGGNYELQRIQTTNQTNYRWINILHYLDDCITLLWCSLRVSRNNQPLMKWEAFKVSVIHRLFEHKFTVNDDIQGLTVIIEAGQSEHEIEKMKKLIAGIAGRGGFLCE